MLELSIGASITIIIIISIMIYLIPMIFVGDLAEKKGYSGLEAFVLSIIITPLFTMLYYGFLPNNKQKD